MQDRERIYIGTYNQLRTVYRTFYGFTLFHVFAICLTTLFGILAIVLFEVLHINNKSNLVLVACVSAKINCYKNRWPTFSGKWGNPTFTSRFLSHCLPIRTPSPLPYFSMQKSRSRCKPTLPDSPYKRTSQRLRTPITEGRTDPKRAICAQIAQVWQRVTKWAECPTRKVALSLVLRTLY